MHLLKRSCYRWDEYIYLIAALEISDSKRDYLYSGGWGKNEFCAPIDLDGANPNSFWIFYKDKRAKYIVITDEERVRLRCIHTGRFYLQVRCRQAHIIQIQQNIRCTYRLSVWYPTDHYVISIQQIIMSSQCNPCRNLHNIPDHSAHFTLNRNTVDLSLHNMKPHDLLDIQQKNLWGLHILCQLYKQVYKIWASQEKIYMIKSARTNVP